MNNWAMVSFVGLGEGGNYVRYLVIVFISMRLGGAKWCLEVLKLLFSGDR